jgi:hypothetical protein
MQQPRTRTTFLCFPQHLPSRVLRVQDLLWKNPMVDIPERAEFAFALVDLCVSSRFFNDVR